MLPNYDDPIALDLVKGIMQAGIAYKQTKLQLQAAQTAEDRQALQTKLRYAELAIGAREQSVQNYLQMVQLQNQQRKQEFDERQVALKPVTDAAERTQEATITRETNRQRIEAQKDADLEIHEAQAAQKRKERDARAAEIETLGTEIGMTPNEVRIAQISGTPVLGKIALEAWNRGRRTEDAEKIGLEGEEKEIYIATGELPDAEKKSFVDIYVGNKADIEEGLANGVIDENQAKLLTDANERELESAKQKSALELKRKAIDDEFGPEGRTPDPKKHQRAVDKLLGAQEDSDEKAPDTSVFPINSANKILVDSLGWLITNKENYQRALQTILPYLEGSKGPDDADPENLDAIAHNVHLAIQMNKPEGERIQGLKAAQEYTLTNLPILWEAMQQVPSENWGKWAEVQERLAKKIGTVGDRAMANFMATTDSIVNYWLRVESGAVINADEIDRLRQLYPSVGNSYELNIEIMRAIGNLLTENLKRDYQNHVGVEWGEKVAEIKLAEPYAMLDEITTKHPSAKQQADTDVEEILNK